MYVLREVCLVCPVCGVHYVRVIGPNEVPEPTCLRCWWLGKKVESKEKAKNGKNTV
jgi:hypothetical protein